MRLISSSKLSTHQIPITVVKEQALDAHGQLSLRIGFRIGGGIDQDFRLSPGFMDSGIYVTGECRPATLLSCCI